MSSDTLFSGVRLLDPASGLDRHGDLLVRDGLIADFGPGLGRPDGATVVAGGPHPRPERVPAGARITRRP